MKAYKAMKKDQTCSGFKFEEGQTYELEGSPGLCGHGFHFCKDLVLTLAYHPVQEDINENVYAEIEVLGEVEFEKPTKHKGVTNKLKVLRIIPVEEVNKLVDGNWNSGDWNSGNSNSGDSNSGNSNSGDSNSGHRNSGDWNSGNWNSGDWSSGDWNSGDSNSGDWNSGHRNSGDWNSGDWSSGHRNSGDWNSGNWNSCDFETGCFNSEQAETVRVFNKPCSKVKWDNAEKPNFLYFNLDSELGYKGSFQKAFESASDGDIELLKALPNFDADVFFEISGIKIDV